MMHRRIALLSLLALAGTSLSGCVAVAIPALAGSAMLGSRVIDNEDDEAAAVPAAAAATAAPVAAAKPAPVPVPTVTVGTAAPITLPPSQPVPVATAPLAAPAPAPVVRAPVTTPVTTPVQAPPPVQVAAPAAIAAPARFIGPVDVPTPPPGAPAVSAAAAAPAAAYPDPARPLTAEQAGFARFVRYGQASARGAEGGADLLSAMLIDPIELDGKRRRCAVGEQLVALIDLDPKDGIFTPPANPAKQPGVALGLAVLRDAGVEIAWLSDLPVNQSGSLRTALEQSGLDPRGEDIISLRRDGDDSKQQRKDNLAGITCIVAIAGDERPDFDERFKYLRSPEAGAGLEPVIGDGWFLVPPLFPAAGQPAGC